MGMDKESRESWSWDWLLELSPNNLHRLEKKLAHSSQLPVTVGLNTDAVLGSSQSALVPVKESNEQRTHILQLITQHNDCFTPPRGQHFFSSQIKSIYALMLLSSVHTRKPWLCISSSSKAYQSHAILVVVILDTEITQIPIIIFTLSSHHPRQISNRAEMSPHTDTKISWVKEGT